ncbi:MULTISPECIES: SDR family oxidoreductase [unclassified Streptomyces]|uniref:SDR family oxidoreductase n=1 Tax=unclassified Streptomyces TaxID=2593676 RepID=UPI0018EE93E8|nr:MULTISPECIES: SDR family oxidoreductase [unclassified Streptomyces]MBJ6629384.1 SDR family oxidoreductase [Streptomyces sp. I4(2020)]
MTEIKGARVLVTGGQRGLGKAFAAALLEAGAETVYVTARRPEPETDPRLVPLALEVRDDASVARLAEQVPDVDIVVNNAGATIPNGLLGNDVAEVAHLFDVNVLGALRVTQAFAPVLARRGGGAVVNVHSVLSWASGTGAYGVTKAALWSLTNSLRHELASQGTQVVGVHLGYTDTDMVRALDVPKNDPRDVAAQVVEALLKGGSEVLADEVTRHFKAALSGPVEGLAVA